MIGAGAGHERRMAGEPSPNRGAQPSPTFWRVLAVVWLVLLVLAVVRGSVLLIAVAAAMLVFSGLEATGRGPLSRRRAT